MTTTIEVHGKTYIGCSVPVDVYDASIIGQSLWFAIPNPRSDEKEFDSDSSEALPELPTGSTYKIVADSNNAEAYVKCFHPKAYSFSESWLHSDEWFNAISDGSQYLSEMASSESEAWTNAASRILKEHGVERMILIEIN